MDKLEQAVLAIKSKTPNSIEFKRAYENLGATLCDVFGNNYIHGTGSAHYGTYVEGKSDYDFTVFENCLVYDDVVSKYEALGFTSCSNTDHPIPEMYLVMRDKHNINLIITNSWEKYTLRNEISNILIGKGLPKDTVVTMFHALLGEPMVAIYEQ